MQGTPKFEASRTSLTRLCQFGEVPGSCYREGAHKSHLGSAAIPPIACN